jgi:hypothetical protein
MNSCQYGIIASGSKPPKTLILYLVPLVQINTMKKTIAGLALLMIFG